VSADSLSRIVAAALPDSLGVPVIVDAKPGAGGNIASEFVSRATPTATRSSCPRVVTPFPRRFTGSCASIRSTASISFLWLAPFRSWWRHAPTVR
jgi:hypothetical protein